MAWTIEEVGRPTLVIAHNKTLAAQLCNEFREFFPANAVEYFVSYYDYYQPEAYVPQADLYIEKDSSRNDDIDRLRHSATSIAAARGATSSSSPRCRASTASARRSEYKERVVFVNVGEEQDRDQMLRKLDRHPVRPQRHAARARPLPRPGRRRRDPAGVLGDRVPHLVLRRRGRADHPLRPADRRGAVALRHDHDLPGDAVRDVEADDRACSRRDPARARRAGQDVRGGREDARGASHSPAHRVRPRDDAGARLLQRHRELLAHPRRPPARIGAAHAARLLPERLPRLHRRVAPDGAADRRHVRGRPLAQADARRLRLPAAVGARQPAAALRRVPRQGAADGLRLGDSRARTSCGIRRASSSSSSARPASSTPRSRCGRRRIRSTTCSARSAAGSRSASACSSRR